MTVKASANQVMRGHGVSLLWAFRNPGRGWQAQRASPDSEEILGTNSISPSDSLRSGAFWKVLSLSKFPILCYLRFSASFRSRPGNARLMTGSLWKGRWRGVANMGYRRQKNSCVWIVAVNACVLRHFNEKWSFCPAVSVVESAR
jgi:hypothetical protein